MKVKYTEPIISDFNVVIENIKYKNTLCTIEVTCHLAEENEEKQYLSFFPCTRASCEEPYFIMGKSFWEKEFGKRQTNQIEKICAKEIKSYLRISS